MTLIPTKLKISYLKPKEKKKKPTQTRGKCWVLSVSVYQQTDKDTAKDKQQLPLTKLVATLKLFENIKEW